MGRVSAGAVRFAPSMSAASRRVRPTWLRCGPGKMRTRPYLGVPAFPAPRSECRVGDECTLASSSLRSPCADGAAGLRCRVGRREVGGHGGLEVARRGRGLCRLAASHASRWHLRSCIRDLDRMSAWRMLTIESRELRGYVRNECTSNLALIRP